MEGISGSTRRGLKKYWGRRSYQRLNGSDQRKRNTVKLGATGAKRRWRIKMAPKIRIPTISSPKKLVVWVRDAYVRMMLSLANSRVMSTATFYGGDSTGGFGRAPPPKEYDDYPYVQVFDYGAGTVGSPRFSIKIGLTNRLQTVRQKW